MPHWSSGTATLLAPCVLMAGALFACSATSESPNSSSQPTPGRDGTPIYSPTTTTIAVSSTLVTIGPVAPPTEQEEVLALIAQFLDETLPDNPGLNEAVTDRETLSQCMLVAGYQMNNLPPPGVQNAPSTLAPPVVLIGPMLSYLAQVCSGVPIQAWSGN